MCVLPVLFNLFLVLDHLCRAGQRAVKLVVVLLLVCKVKCTEQDGDVSMRLHDLLEKLCCVII